MPGWSAVFLRRGKGYSVLQRRSCVGANFHMKGISKVLLPMALLPALSLAVISKPSKPAAVAGAVDRHKTLFAAPARFDPVGRIIAPVMIDGKGPFRFLVDTGADGSMLSARLAHRLGLVPAQGAGEQVEGTTGNENMPWVTVTQLRVGKIVKSDMRMPISQSPVLAGLDGILGLAGFGPVQVAVDFRNNKVTIGSSHGRIWGWGYLDIAARRTPGGLLMIPARVGSVRVVAVIDTGAEETLGNSALRAALLKSSAKKGSSARIYGVTKKVSTGGLMASPTIFLGPAAIRDLNIVYSDIPIFKIWHLQSRPALIIGMNVLAAVDSLILDYADARVYLRPPLPSSFSVGERQIYSPSIIRGD